MATSVMNSEHAQEQGFTLLEALVVTAILGLLTAIALPQLQHRDRAYDKQAQAVLRTAALAEESYFLSNNAYVSCDQSSCPLVLGHLGAIPAGVVLNIVGDSTSFTGTAYHTAGTGVTYRWN